MTLLKNDHPKIIRKLNELKSASWVGSRKWWPHFVYHTTSMENAVRILQSGRIYSRNKASANGTIARDIASVSVITNTQDHWKDYVRFYLRPKTPTLFINEGARPKLAIREGAHCPSPVCFLFDSHSLLTREDCLFSNGNLGSSSVVVDGSADFFCQLPFEKIYHDSWRNPNERDIIFHRCAEAIVQDEVDLSGLRHVICRSNAEKDTLLALLDWNTANLWRGSISVDTRYPLFNETWNFVRDVTYTGQNLIVKFNEQTKNPRGPFKLTWRLMELWNHAQFQVNEEEVTEIPKDLNLILNRYENKCLNFQIWFDDNLMFNNNFYHDSDQPF
jgi:hypothetical protein